MTRQKGRVKQRSKPAAHLFGNNGRKLNVKDQTFCDTEYFMFGDNGFEHFAGFCFKSGKRFCFAGNRQL